MCKCRLTARALSRYHLWDWRDWRMLWAADTDFVVCLELESSAFQVIVKAHSLQMVTTISRLKQLQTEHLQAAAKSPPGSAVGLGRRLTRRGSVYIDAYRVVLMWERIAIRILQAQDDSAGEQANGLEKELFRKRLSGHVRSKRHLFQASTPPAGVKAHANFGDLPPEERKEEDEEDEEDEVQVCIDVQGHSDEAAAIRQESPETAAPRAASEAQLVFVHDGDYPGPAPPSVQSRTKGPVIWDEKSARHPPIQADDDVLVDTQANKQERDAVDRRAARTKAALSAEANEVRSCPSHVVDKETFSSQMSVLANLLSKVSDDVKLLASKVDRLEEQQRLIALRVGC